MNLQDILQSGYQQFKQSDIPVATLLRGEYNNFFPSVGRNLSAQLDTLSSAEEVIQVGNLVLAKKPVKVSPNDPMFSFIDKETGGLLSF